MEKSAQKSVEKSMEKSAQKSVDKSVEKSVEKSAQKSVEKSAQKYLCICVFARQTPWNIVFEVLVPFCFKKNIAYVRFI